MAKTRKNPKTATGGSAKKDSKKGFGVAIVKNGPYLVSGSLPLSKEIIVCGKEGEPEKWGKGEKYRKQDSCGLCRCGKSGSKPFCDGTHMKGFDGAETASRKKYAEQAGTLSGPNLVLTDAQPLCAAARFCHRAGSVWALTEQSANPKARKIAIQEACGCPSGRLVACGKRTGKPIEPKFKPSISLIEDPQNKVSGPIWVKGGVPIKSADGTTYEIRNRVTLCRCGHSFNKPFCDGTHISAGFSDGDSSLVEKKGKKKGGRQ